MFVLEVELSETLVERSVCFELDARFELDCSELDTCSAPTAKLHSSGSFSWCSMTLVPCCLPMIIGGMA